MALSSFAPSRLCRSLRKWFRKSEPVYRYPVRLARPRLEPLEDRVLPSAITDLQSYIQGQLASHTASFGPLTIGDVSLGGFLQIGSLSLTLGSDAAYNSTTKSWSGTIDLSTTSATLFPGSDFSASITPSTGKTAVTGTYTIGGGYALSSATIAIAIGEALDVNASGVALSYDPSSSAQQTLVTISSATLSSPNFSSLGTTTVSNLVIHQDGFSLGNVQWSSTSAVSAGNSALQFNSAPITETDTSDGTTATISLQHLAQSVVVSTTGGTISSSNYTLGTNAAGNTTITFASGHIPAAGTVITITYQTPAVTVSLSNFNLQYGGTAATFTYTESGGALSAPVIVNGGSGYFNGGNGSLSLAFTDAAGSGAVGTATITDGVVTSVSITTAGTNYDASTIISVAVPTITPATFTYAQSGGVLSSPKIDKGGSGYFDGGDGTLPLVFSDAAATSRATGTATIKGGVVTAVSITNGGTGYDNNTQIGVAASSSTPSVSGTVSFAANGAALFPNVSLLDVSLGSLAGSFDFSNSHAGVMNLQVNNLNISLGDAFTINLGQVTLTPDNPTNMFTASNVVVTANLFSGLPPITLPSFTLTQTGFSLSNFTIPHSGSSGTITIGNFMSISSVSIAVSGFSVDTAAVTPTPVVSGTITATLGDITLFPGNTAVTSTLSNFQGTYNLTNGEFSLTSKSGFTDSLTLSLFGALTLTAQDITITPDQNKLVTIGSATLSVAPLNDLTVSVAGLEIDRTGFTIGSATASVGDLTLGSHLLTVTAPNVTLTDIAYTFGGPQSPGTLSGTVALSAAGASLDLGTPNLSLGQTNATYNLASRQLLVTLANFDLNLAGFADISANNIELSYIPQISTTETDTVASGATSITLGQAAIPDTVAVSTAATGAAASTNSTTAVTQSDVTAGSATVTPAVMEPYIVVGAKLVINAGQPDQEIVTVSTVSTTTPATFTATFTQPHSAGFTIGQPAVTLTPGTDYTLTLDTHGNATGIHFNLNSSGLFSSAGILAAGATLNIAYTYDTSPEMLVGATGVNAFIGTGTAQNPQTGVSVTNGTLALATFDNAGTITYAFDVKGTASILGLPANSINIAPSNIEIRKDTAGTLSTSVTFATATGTSMIDTNGAVTGVTVPSGQGGFGYQTPPTVTLSGGGGTGATGTAILTNGVVTGVNITNVGSNYTSAPTVTFSSPTPLPLNFPTSPETDIRAQGLSISVGNAANPFASLTGDFSFSQFTATGGDTFLAIEANNITTSVAAGSVSVTVTGANLGLLLDTTSPNNYALVVDGGTDSLTGVPGLTLTSSGLIVRERNGTFPSTLMTDVGNITPPVLSTGITTDLTSLLSDTTPGNITDVEGTAILAIANFVSMTGNFGFQKFSNGSFFAFGASGLNIVLGNDTTNLTLANASLGVVVAPGTTNSTTEMHTLSTSTSSITLAHAAVLNTVVVTASPGGTLKPITDYTLGTASNGDTTINFVNSQAAGTTINVAYSYVATPTTYALEAKADSASLNGVPDLSLTTNNLVVLVRNGLDVTTVSNIPTSVQVPGGPPVSLTDAFTDLGSGTTNVTDIKGDLTLSVDGAASLQGHFGFQSFKDQSGAQEIAIGATGLTATLGPMNGPNLTVLNATLGLVIQPSTTTTSAHSVSTGSAVVTPAVMEPYIVDGASLVIDKGLAGQETVTVSAVTATTFTATFANAHNANFTIEGGGYALEATATSASLNNIPNNDLQLSVNNLLVEARSGLDLSSANGLPAVQTSGGPITLDFGGLGAGANKFLNVEGNVSLTVANFVTLSGAFGFQTTTVGSDTYLAMGMNGNINVTAGSDSLNLANASIGVLVHKPATGSTTYAVQASEGSDPTATTFNGPGGLSLSASNLLLLVNRGLDVTSLPAGVPTAVSVPTIATDAGLPDAAPTMSTTAVTAADVTAGSTVITPAVMEPYIVQGASLVIDEGTASQETVTVSAVTATTFTATFTQSHTAGFSIGNSLTSTTLNTAVTAADVSAGSTTVTPAVMKPYIFVGANLIINAGQADQEIVTVSAVTATTFTATFANQHSAGATIGDYSVSLTHAALEDTVVVTATNGSTTTTLNLNTDYTLGTSPTGNTTVNLLVQPLAAGTTISATYTYIPRPTLVTESATPNFPTTNLPATTTISLSHLALTGTVVVTATPSGVGTAVPLALGTGYTLGTDANGNTTVTFNINASGQFAGAMIAAAGTTISTTYDYQSSDNIALDFSHLPTGTTNVTEIEGHASLSIAGFASLSGDFGFEKYTPNGTTTSTTAVTAAGSTVISPAVMEPYIVDGASLVIDKGLADQETVTVTAVDTTAKTFTATFAKTHSANFTIDATSTLLIAATNVNAVLGTADTNLTITGASLGLMIQGGNYAFQANAPTVALNVTGLSISATDLEIKVRHGLDATSVDGTVIDTANNGTVTLDFSGLPSGDVTEIQGMATVNVANFASLTGTYSFTEATTTDADNKGTTTKILVGATGVNAFVGTPDGPNGNLGVHITNANLGLVIYRDSEASGSTYALQASASSIMPVGLPNDVFLNATNVSAAINTTGAAVNETIPGTTQTVSFADGTNVKSFGGTLTLTIGGFSLMGDFSFTKLTATTPTTAATFTYTNTSGVLSAPVVAMGGAGYLGGGSGTLPLVFTDTTGSGASGYATITNGVVTGATITAGGTGYDNNTIISVNASISKLLVGATNINAPSITATAGGNFSISNGTLGLVFYTDTSTTPGKSLGYALSASATAMATSGSALSASATLTILRNTTTTAENDTVTVGATTIPVVFTPSQVATVSGSTTTPFQSIVVNNASLNIDNGLIVTASSGTTSTPAPGASSTSLTGVTVRVQDPNNTSNVLFTISAGSAVYTTFSGAVTATQANGLNTRQDGQPWGIGDKDLELTNVSFSIGSYVSFSANSIDLQHFTANSVVTDAFIFSGATVALLNNGQPMVTLTGSPAFHYTTGSSTPANNGFILDSFTDPGFTFLDPTTTLGPVTLVDPSVSLSNFSFELSGTLSATVTTSAATATVGTGPVSATFSQLSGSFDLNLGFDLSHLTNPPTVNLAGFTITAQSFTANLGSYLTLSATGTQANPLTINPTAGANQDLISFATLSATLNIPGTSVDITGSASNFAIEGNGTFLAKTDFGVSITLGQDGSGNADAGGLGWPSWLPLQSASVSLQWPHFTTDPSHFTIDLSATLQTTLAGLTVSGTIKDVVIDPTLIAAGQFPITSIGTVAVGLSGNLFGGSVSGTLLAGVVRYDTMGNVVDGLGNLIGTTTPDPDQNFASAFYAGIEGGFNLADMAGFNIRIGLSQFGPLQVYLEANVPIPLGDTGLFLSDFRGGITFGATFPDILSSPPQVSDALKLGGPAFSTPDTLTAAQWQAQLAAQVVLQIHSGQTGGFTVPSGPYIIQAGLTLYDVNPNAFRIDGDVFFDTSGKFLVIGSATIGNSESVGVKVFTDLSPLFLGEQSLSILFLVQMPAQPNAENLPPSVQVYGFVTFSDVNNVFQITIGGEADFSVLGGLTAEVTGTLTLTFTSDSFNITLSGGMLTIPEIQSSPIGTADGSLTVQNANGTVEVWGGFLLTENLTALNSEGIYTQAQVFVKLNTTDQTQTVTLSNGTLSLDPESFSLFINGTATFQVGGKNTFELVGTLALDINPTSLTIFVNAALDLVGPDPTKPIMTFNANGLIYVSLSSHLGFAAKMALTATGNPPDGITFDQHWLLVMNTTLTTVTYVIPEPVATNPPSPPVPIVMGPDYSSSDPLAPPVSYETPGTGANTGKRTLVIPDGAPATGLTDYRNWIPANANDYFSLLGRGSVTVANAFTMSGNLNIDAQISNSTVTFTLDANATLDVDLNGNQVFSFQVTGGIQFKDGGIVAALDLQRTGGANAQSGLGFGLNGNFLFELNTTNMAQTVNGITVPQDPSGNNLFAMIQATGDLTFLGNVIDLQGTFDITLTGSSLTVSIQSTVTLLGVSFTADGSAVIYYDSSPGLEMDILLGLPSGDGIAPISALGNNFIVTGDFELEVNTCSIARTDPTTGNTINPGFQVNVSNVGVYLFGFDATGSFSFGFTTAGFNFNTSLDLNFLNIVHVDITAYYYGPDNFSFSGSIGFNYGDSWFGLGANLSITVDNNGFAASIGGSVTIIGITIGASGSLNISSTDVSITFSVSTFLGSVSHTFDFGAPATRPPVAPSTPPPPALAGFSNTNTDNPNGDLLLYIGTDVNLRVNSNNVETGAQTAENYTLTRVSGDPNSTSGETIMVSALGFKQQYDNVQAILVNDTQTGNDTITIDDGILVPVSITLGSGNNTIKTGGGSATVVISGDGNNTVTSDTTGADTVTINGNGNNKITTGGSAGGSTTNVTIKGSGNDQVTTGAGPTNVYDYGTGANTIAGGSGGGSYYYGVDGTGAAYASKGASSLSTTSGNFSVIASGYSSYLLSDASLVAGSYTLTLSGVTSATLNASSTPGANSFSLNGWSGTATLNGHGTNNTFSIVPGTGVNGVNYVLSNSSLSVTGGVTQTINLSDIQTADLTGAGTGSNTYDVSSWTGNGNLTGAGTSNTLIATNDVVSFTLTDTLFQRTNHGDLTLSGIQTANLTGGPSDNTFNVGQVPLTVPGNNWSGTANLDGKGGSNTFNIFLSGVGTGTVNIANTGSTNTDTNTLNVTGFKTILVNSTNVSVGIQQVNYGTSGINILNVFGGKSGLTFNVRSTNADVPTTVQTTGNANVINVGSTAGASPFSAGVLGGIQGPLTLTGGGQDTATIDDGAGVGQAGFLTGTTITGMGMGSQGITYSGLVKLNVNIGPHGNTFNIRSTNTQTNVTALADNMGSNTINVGSQAGAVPPAPGIVDHIQGALTVAGGGNTTLIVDDTGSSASKTGLLTKTALTGLAMGPQGITYSGLAELDINLGSGGNTFNVRSTSPSTMLHAGAGVNTVNIGSRAPAAAGTVNGILGALNVVGSGADTMNVDDTGSTGPKTGALSATTLTGLGMGPGISYSGLANLNISLGSGGNTFLISNTAVGTTTTLYSGMGSDRVDVANTSSPLTVNTQKGTDTVNVQAIGTVANINAGGGNDTINVSSNAPTNTGKLSGIAAVLNLNGGSGSTTANVSDTGNSTPSNSTLTPTTLTSTAFGTGGSLSYSSLAKLNIFMGSGGNIFLITNTASNTTTMVNSGTGADTVDVQGTGGPTTVNTGGGSNLNVVNVGSTAPATGGIVDNIQGALIVVGNSADTMNVDDTGSTTAKMATLTATTLTGMGMGAKGITYSGLANLNINLGSGGSTGNSFFINVADGTNLPALTNITAAQGGKDTLVGNWVADFNRTLNLRYFVTSTIAVGHDFNGTMTDKNPGYIQSISIGGSLTASGILLVSSTADPANPITPTGLLGDIGLMTVHGYIAGLVQTTGNITTLDVGPPNTPTTGGVNDVKVTGQILVGGQLTTASFAGDVAGLIQETLTINSLYIGGSLTPTGTVSAVNLVNPALGNLNSLIIVIDLAGTLIVSGTLTTARIHRGTPGTITAGQIGTIYVDAGYGPAVAQIKENGIQRLIEANVPSAPFLTPTPPPAPTPAMSPAGITFQYFYEGLYSPTVEGISSTNLANPQLTTRVSNATGNTLPDQFDFSLVTYSDTAKFNLARLDTPLDPKTKNPEVSGIRNVNVEGDILTSITGATSPFFNPNSSPAGVYLPTDNLAGVEVRDFFPLASVNAKTIQAVAFGSSVATNGQMVTGQNDTGSAARNVLTTSTLILKAGSLNVNAGETFRVPFAHMLPPSVNSPGRSLQFFIDTSTTNGGFDNKDVDFVVQDVSTANSSGTGNNTQPSNVARGSVVALVTAVETFGGTGNLKSEVMENISLQGDGGSLTTFQPVGNTSTLPKKPFTPSITSTGPLGDVSVLGAMPSITAPRIFGSLVASGPIPATSIIQTTGMSIDPITGASSAVPADLGRVYVATSIKGSVVTTSVVQASGTLDGEIISRGNLISLVEPSGNLTGLVAAQGNIGTFFTPSGGTAMRLGGITVGNPGSGRTFSGQVLTLGSIIGDVTLNGGMVGGRIAARNSILGNVTILGTIDSNSAIVSGGSIGSSLYGTKLMNSGNILNILGIVAAVGPINAGTIGTTNVRFYQQNDAADATVIDKIFTQGVTPLSAADVFDQTTLGDLLNLNQMGMKAGLALNLSKLTVNGGNKAGNLLLP